MSLENSTNQTTEKPTLSYQSCLSAHLRSWIPTHARMYPRTHVQILNHTLQLKSDHKDTIGFWSRVYFLGRKNWNADQGHNQVLFKFWLKMNISLSLSTMLSLSQVIKSGYGLLKWDVGLLPTLVPWTIWKKCLSSLSIMPELIRYFKSKVNFGLIYTLTLLSCWLRYVAT